MKLPPVLVLGIDTPVGLTVVRELGRHGVPVHGIGENRDALGRTSRYLAGFSLRPEGVPLSEWLPERIFHTGAHALFAIGADDLVALAAFPEEIEGCRILTPRKPQLDIAFDRSRTLALAAGLGIDVPESWQPLSGEDFARYAATLTYPVVVKWAHPQAMARILAKHGLPLVKAQYAATPDVLLALLRRYAPLREWPLVQAYCPGYGLGQALHMADGKASLAFQHRRVHEWPPQGGIPTLCESIPLDRHAHQRERSEALLAAIGWSGPAIVEYRYDPEAGKYWLMGVTGQFWNSLPLALHCGAEFAWEHYRRAMLGETGAAATPVAERRARFMIPETKRLLAILFSAKPFANFRRARFAELIAYIAGFFDPRMRYFVFSPGDPKPMLQQAGAVIHRFLRREKQVED